MSFTKNPIKQDVPDIKADLSHLIDEAKEDIIHEIEQDRYWLFHSENSYFVCSIAESDKIGQSHTSQVYKAWKIIEVSPKNYTYDADYALKITRIGSAFKTEEQAKKDAEISKLFYPKETQPLIVHEGFAYLITKRLPNNVLLDAKRNLNPLVRKLGISQRIQLIMDILALVKTLNEKGQVHGDLTGSNILFSQDSKGTIKPFLCDFDNTQVARQLKEDEVASPGSPGHLSYESLTGDFSNKVDLLSLRPVLLSILGAIHPLEKKLEARSKAQQESGSIERINSAELRAPLDATGIADLFKACKLTASHKAKLALASTITTFLFAWDNLPSNSECLDPVINFFNAINVLLKPTTSKQGKFGFFSVGKLDQAIEKTIVELHPIISSLMPKVEVRPKT